MTTFRKLESHTVFGFYLQQILGARVSKGARNLLSCKMRITRLRRYVAIIRSAGFYTVEILKPAPGAAPVRTIGLALEHAQLLG